MRFIPHLLWSLGLVVLLMGFGRFSAASLPYQDPTPELLAIQRGQMESAKIVASVGGLLFVSGVLGVAIRRRSRSSR